MALIIEDSEKVTQKSIEIPKKAQETFKAMEKVYEPYLDTVEGGHVMKSYASDRQYNKKSSENSDGNGEKKTAPSISVDVAKMRLSRQNKFPENSIQYQLYGGKLAHDILKKGVESARKVQPVDAVKPPKPNSVEPPKLDTKSIKKDVKKTVIVPENKIHLLKYMMI